MTRRSITTALVTLLVSLVVPLHATAIRADAPCDVDSEGNCAVIMVAPIDVTIFSTSSSHNVTRTREDFTEQQVIEFDALTAISQGTTYDDRLASPETSCSMVPAPCELPSSAAELVPDAITAINQNAMDPGQRVCYDGSAVLLTCYTRQPDGRWQRAEMQEDTTWVVVGMVTYDEMQAAVAAMNARVS